MNQEAGIFVLNQGQAKAVQGDRVVRDLELVLLGLLLFVLGAAL